MTKKEVVVLGGGFAGISSAIHLADSGYSVLLIEKKRFLGGRAFSFQDPTTGQTLDNGQHLMMGCYHYTLELLNKIDAINKLSISPSLEVKFLDDQGQFHLFQTPRKNSSLGLLLALTRLSSIQLKDRIQTFVSSPFLFLRKNLQDLTVKEWLTQAKQPASIQSLFWEPFCLAVLNESIQSASAQLLKKVLTESFKNPNQSNGLIFPKVGLTELVQEGTFNYLKSRQGQIKMLSAVKSLHIKNSRIEKIELGNGETIQAYATISTLPPKQLKKLLPESIQSIPLFSNLEKCQTSPILSIYLWLKKPITDELFLALLDSPIHWIFNRNKILNQSNDSLQLLALTISHAHDWMELSNETIQTKIFSELSRFFKTFTPSLVQQIKIIKEPDATLTASPNMLKYRLGSKTEFNNFFLAGDWTQTGLPATIESAVLSGKSAVDELIKWEKN